MTLPLGVIVAVDVPVSVALTVPEIVAERLAVWVPVTQGLGVVVGGTYGVFDSVAVLVSFRLVVVHPAACNQSAAVATVTPTANK